MSEQMNTGYNLAEVCFHYITHLQIFHILDELILHKLVFKATVKSVKKCILPIV